MMTRGERLFCALFPFSDLNKFEVSSNLAGLEEPKEALHDCSWAWMQYRKRECYQEKAGDEIYATLQLELNFKNRTWQLFFREDPGMRMSIYPRFDPIDANLNALFESWWP